MHRSNSLVRASSVAALLAALSACSERPTQPAPRITADHAPSAAIAQTNGRYLVLAKGGGFGDLAPAVTSLGGTLESIHVAAGFAVVSGIGADGAAKLAARNDVADVEPDATISLDIPIAAAEADITSVADVVTSQSNPAGASRYLWQWNMRDIGANLAWAAGKLGDPSVTVAILDTGIDYDAPDLNGLVDLSRSTSFVASDNVFAATYFPTRNAISDFHGHGTNVATQVSSKAAALAGVTSKTTLIGVKVLGWNGTGSLSAKLNGVLWAADHGADVANMSLGGGFAKAGLGRYVGLINRTFDYANQHGMLIVVAAGNDGADLDHNGNLLSTYCSVVHVLCVSSVGPGTSSASVDTPSYYTNIGRSSISVAAPGGNATPSGNSFVVSAWPWGNDIASWVWSYCSKTRFAGLNSSGVPVLTSCVSGNRITGYIGTSQATPHVAGLAALLVAEHGHGQPELLKTLIERSAIDLGQPGVDPFFGHGRISITRALGL